MISKTIAAGLLALAALMAAPALATPAPATQNPMQADYRGPMHEQHGWDRHGGMHQDWQRHGVSPMQVRWTLRQHGFRDVRGIGRRGPVYLAWARDFRGVLVRVVISARSGSLLSVQRMRG